MNDVVGTLLKALGLVALVVFLFLQNLRSTLIPVLAIPGFNPGDLLLFHPSGIYDQHAHHVRLRAGDRHRRR